MSAHVGRNDACPCGSGRKYKNCCEGKSILSAKNRRVWMLAGLGIVVVAALAWLMRLPSLADAPTGVGVVPPSASANSVPDTSVTPNPAANNPAPLATNTPTSTTPPPWAYDATTNRHFDPGHGHWHDGPPPPQSARGTSSTAPPSLGQTSVPVAGISPGTPAPWTYDRAKNQHWDPKHGHWHPGPPPPAGLR